MELVTLRQENAFVQEKCEPSGKREELHDVYIVSGIYRNSVTSCPSVSNAGLQKSASIRLGQVDFPAGQVTFHCYLLDEQGIRQVVCQLN